ncbi:PREDICTED: uncharacterized protein LOC106126165 [Papilio xuthus]|uniref:Uncharacterized protein LOC106126165 n=1 Tax=Papilio xuthus TaxID=66420 RepID=A0AAJ6ZTT4_PAPXU|nr:PREDICTED: uncharacterized protein LOC106126165 [Papilio xuthus]
MEEFLEKIKKKLSVDNILDFMKDGKLKEEIKQSLTATINLNEKPKQEEVRSADISKNMMDPKNQITVENIQHKTNEDQTPVNLSEPLNLADENEIQEKASGTNLQAAIIELNETINLLDVKEIKKKASKPNLTRPDTTAESSPGQRESTATGSIEGASEPDKSNIKVLQKPLTMPSQTEQVESKTQFDDFFNLT